MCNVFNVSKSSYYAWLKSGVSRRWKTNHELLIRIKDIFQVSSETYGSPRIREELRSQGLKVSRPRIARIMKAAGMRARKPKRFIATTDSRHNYPIVPNVLNRNFKATRPGQIWVSDITYVKTAGGWLYLTVIIDIYDRKVVGWSMSKRMSAEETSIAAWRMAVRNRPVMRNLIFHSDRGIQYACSQFANILKANQLVTRSMSRKGNCWDNAVAESFFKTIKAESIYRGKYINQDHARLVIFKWIETWYNRKRRHSALGYRTIEEFENLNINQKMAA